MEGTVENREHTITTAEFNHAALEASIRLEETKLSVIESMRLEREGKTTNIRKLLDDGKLALAKAWRLLKVLDEAYETIPSVHGG